MKKLKLPIVVQKPNSYLIVRVQLVHAKRNFIGFWIDKELAWNKAIPDTPEKAVELNNRIATMMKEYGVAIQT